MRFSAMGDVAMTLPVLHTFVESHPEVELCILSHQNFAPLFASLTKSRFIGVNLDDYEGLGGLYKLHKILRREKFDVVLDLHDVIRTSVLRIFFRLAGTKVHVIDKGRAEKRALTRRYNKILTPLKSTFERYADVFRAAGYDMELQFQGIVKEQKDLAAKVHDLLREGDTHAKRIGIAPFAKHKGKIYPIDKMEKVVKTLSEQGYHLFFFGGGAEELAVLENWESLYPFCVAVSGKLNLAEELELIGNLDLMVSMDSANMHLASLVNTPVISVWGATHPFAGFHGWRQQPENIVQTGLECRPCSVYGNKDCFRKDYACLAELAPETILRHIYKAINNTVL